MNAVPITPRETIIAALLAKLTTLSTFNTIAREWSGVELTELADNLDALFLVELPEDTKKVGRGMPSKVTLHFDVVFVVKNEEGSPGGTVLNPILDALDTLFAPKPADTFTSGGAGYTLGGLVYDVWTEGKTQKNYAYLSGRASVGVVPLHVLTYNPS